MVNAVDELVKGEERQRGEQLGFPRRSQYTDSERCILPTLQKNRSDTLRMF